MKGKEYLEAVVDEDGLVGEGEIEMLLGREGGRGGRTGEEGEAIGREEGIPEGVGVGGGTEGGRNAGETAGVAGGSEGKDVGDASFGEIHEIVLPAVGLVVERRGVLL